LFKWFRKKLTVEEQYAKVKSLGIELKQGMNLNQVISGCGREGYEEKPYLLLYISLGSEMALDDHSFTYPSDDIWHLDRECIEDHGDYIPIIERISDLLKDEIIVNDIADYVDIENNEIWVSFTIDGKAYKYELAVDNDWLDMGIFKIFSELLEEYGCGKRFYYYDLGQGVLVGAYENEQWKALNNLPVMFQKVM